MSIIIVRAMHLFTIVLNTWFLINTIEKHHALFHCCMIAISGSFFIKFCKQKEN